MDLAVANKTRSGLNDRESGHEKMKKQLTELGMYEEGMSFEEMKDTLTVIDNSKQSVEETSMKFSSQPVIELNDSSSPQSSLSLFDYTPKKMKSQDVNPEVEIDEEELATNTENHVGFHDNKTDEKPSSHPRPLSPSPDKDGELNCSRLLDPHKSKASASSTNNIEDSSRLSSNCKILDDVPSKSRFSTKFQRKFDTINGIPHNLHETLDKQRATLNKMAIMWHSYNTKSDCDEIQWGSPIKVETANGSLDKKPYVPSDEDLEIFEPQNTEKKSAYINTEKTSPYIGLRPRVATKNYELNCDEEDDDDEYIFQKRKKTTFVSKPPIKRRVTNKAKKRQSQETGTEQENNLLRTNSIDPEVQANPRKRLAKSPTPEYPELSQLKKSQSSSSPKSVREISNNYQSRKENASPLSSKKDQVPNKISKGLNPTEIESMITDDEDEVVPSSQPFEKTTDRLNKSNAYLQQYKNREDKQEEEDEKWKRILMATREREQEERLQARLKEAAAKSSKREMEEKKEQSQQSKYQNIKAKAKTRWSSVRTELESQDLQNKHIILDSPDEESLNMVSEEIITSDEDNQTKSTKGNVECPLCNKYFTPNEIETHADECATMSDSILQESINQDKANVELGKALPSQKVLSCQQCQKFKTVDPKLFEQHCSYDCERNFDDQGSYVTIPVESYTFLEEQHYINNTFSDNNDVKNRWVGNSSFLCENKFPSTSKMLQAQRLLIVFHGIDTFAKIKFNDHEVGKTDNMFTRYVFDIKDYIVNDTNSNNELMITIESPIKFANDVYDNHSKDYIVYPKCVPKTYHGECHVNHIRKMQASFGWDWGPAIPSSGIWRDVELVIVNDAAIIDHTIDLYQVNDTNWKIYTTVLLETALNNPNNPIQCELSVVLKINDSYVINSTKIDVMNGQKHSVSLDVREADILRWWPNGYGSQILYNITTKLKTESGIQIRKKRIGFRTVELVQEPLKKGLSFYFRINKIPIFAKGSNFIPTNIYPSKSSNRTYIRYLLESAKQVNMNMLRVWGGGVYESDFFYDLADELGLMIWQDFMFACAMYPTTPEFLNSVREEVKQNVWRLKSHPSIVIWAGNNENEAALYGNWYGTGSNPIYKSDYIKLYVDIIKFEVEKLDFTRPFVVSSPSNGAWADQNGWIGTDPYSPLYGDIHYYNYLANGWDINIYPKPRFSSEYGFQSLPSIYGLKPMVKSIQDLRLNSEFLEHRQHLPGGNELLTSLIKKNFRLPQSNDPLQDFENYIYLSQINQAQSVKVQTESYRQAKSYVNDSGEGKTMGALYWQLNDVWPAPSWSSIDDGGRWKILHNYAEDFFAPIIISPRLSPIDDLTIFIVSDELHPRFNCSVEMNVYKFWEESSDIFTRKFNNVSVETNAAYELTTINFEDVLKNASCGETFYEAKKKCIVEFYLRDQFGEPVAPANYLYPSSPKDFNLPACEMTVSFNSTDYAATIQSSCIQLFVWFDFPGYLPGRFSENGFHVLKSVKKVEFHPGNLSFDLTEFIRHVTVVSLAQIYETPQPLNTICIDCLNL
ncbi:beta-mannosidase [Microplitis mediator]|uniref:beta-mannosidase n=1 Tax=Microplitis mediator TaxID=375433 RepID=UPI002555FCEB|nr:beta-mannosidase [Microplitis mediator]